MYHVPYQVGLAFRSLVLVAICAAILSGCSREALSLVFDIPEKEEVASGPVYVAPQDGEAGSSSAPRPAIEGTLDPDSVVAMLPRDHAGNIDWMDALRSGVIRPKNGVLGDSAFSAMTLGSEFALDFYLPGPAEVFDAIFPHSSHTSWVACQQCHPRIFRYRDAEIKMAEVLQGKYCGECHGKVAFPPATACERCHVDMPAQPNRAEPELLGTIRLARANTVPAVDSTLIVLRPDSSRIDLQSLPAAVFPHWVHRIRYTCKTCHMDIFEPEAGANQITMSQIGAGQACGVCHNGQEAFEAGFGQCQRCHLSTDEQ